MPLKIERAGAYSSAGDSIARMQLKEKNIVFNSANNISKDIVISPCDKFIFRILDKLNPFLQKHSKLNKFTIKISEKLIKLVDTLTRKKIH